MPDQPVPEFGWKSAAPECTADFVIPALRDLGGDLIRPGARVLDVGCGNGFNAGQYLAWGCRVTGIDASDVGVRIAAQTYPAGRFVSMLIEDDVLPALGEPPFDLVNSTEVVEHLYDPIAWARCCFNALRPGGRLLVSTPYHGFLKNLAISLVDGWDKHFEAHKVGGHIKFFSPRTLGAILTQAGFRSIRFRGTGRAPYLWKSMVLSADRPG
ncbi:MAG: class I SAM-dependent methyltransferase [Phycisphaerae bacterium]|nr:class I SAM-dependent methyltransferase [Phycisphaerae bacterium]